LNILKTQFDASSIDCFYATIAFTCHRLVLYSIGRKINTVY